MFIFIYIYSENDHKYRGKASSSKWLLNNVNVNEKYKKKLG